MTGKSSASQPFWFTFIDLLAGLGGTRLAFERAGGRCLFASEINEEARKVYLDNFGEMPSRDIREIDERDVPDHDVLTARIPSGAVSSTVRVHPKEEEAEDLFDEVARIIKAKKPRALFFEALPGLIHFRGRYQKIKDVLESKLGYRVRETILDASGLVPQRCRRLYIVGFKKGFPFRFPVWQDRGRRLRDIIEHDVDQKYTVSDRIWKRIQETISQKKGDKRELGRIFRRYEIADLDGILRGCLTPNTHRTVFIPHGEGNPRRFTPREYARLMGFPDSFKIPVSDRHAYKLLGSSVVVPVVKNIARALSKSLTLSPGEYLERRVARWLKTHHGFDAKVRDLARGAAAARAYQVDVHAWKEAGTLFVRPVHLWAECKERSKSKANVKKSVLQLLVQKAVDVKNFSADWSPDILMVVTDSGFDEDSNRIADSHGIYLVKVDKGFKFVGSMSREDFEKIKFSQY